MGDASRDVLGHGCTLVGGPPADNRVLLQDVELVALAVFARRRTRAALLT